MDVPSTGGQEPLDTVTAAEILLPCSHVDFDSCLSFFSSLGFRVLAISPADAPNSALLGAYGLRMRLEASAVGTASGISLRICSTIPDSLLGGKGSVVSPNGVTVTVVPAVLPVLIPPTVVLPPGSLIAARSEPGGAFHSGRAGLLYRDLLPCRLGGRVIASHIRVETDGPVSDYVHFHRVSFQVRFCSPAAA